MNYTNEILDVLRKVARRDDTVRLEEGLTETELARAENLYGFQFPPDLRELLANVLLLDPPAVERASSPNWRDVPNDYIQARMNWTWDALAPTAKRETYRLPGWPEEPQPDEDWIVMTRASLDAAPILIPIYSHRFLPATPAESGNPVFSMYGTDTIIYGADLLEYFCNEFHVTDPRPEKPQLKKIPFWSALAGDE